MSEETFRFVVATAAIVVAFALIVLALAAVAVARSARRTLDRLDEEVPPTLAQLRASAAELASLAADAHPRLIRLDGLADEAEETLVSLRGTIAATESIVRGPADVVEGARRTVSSVGEGLVSGADRLRRRFGGDEDADG